MAKNDTILMLGAVAIGGYALFKSGILESLGGVAEGASEAAGGIGAGLGTAGRGLGEGISDISGQIASISGDVAQLTSFVGEFGSWTAQQFTELQQSSLREHTQADIVDVGAFQKTQEPLINIQAESDLIIAQEQAERSRIIEEEKTQYVQFAAEAPEKAWSALKAAGSAMWRYNPKTLLTSWITGQASIEEDVAQQLSSSPLTSVNDELNSSVSAASTGSSGGGVSYSGNVAEDVAALPEGASVLTIPYIRKSPDYVESAPIDITPEPEQSTISKIGSWFVRRMIFI